MLRGTGKGCVGVKNGRMRYRYKNASGADRVKVLGPDTMTESEPWRLVGELGYDKLVGKPDDDCTLIELARRYLAYGKTKTGKDKAESTKGLDKQLVRDYVDGKLADRVAIEIEPVEFDAHLEKISAGVRPHVRTLLSAIYRHSQKMGWIPRTQECNPINWVSVSTVSDYEAVTVTPEQAGTMAESLPLFVRALLFTIAATAMRVSEALALRWSDIEWKQNQIQIRRAWVRGTKKKIGDPKSKASKAPVAMHQLLAKILQAWRNETMYAKDSDWVFPSFRMKGKQPRTATTMVSDYIRPAAVKPGIITEECPRFGFHNFRHSLATYLIQQGEDPDVVRRMLRHSDLPTTMLYTHMDGQRISAQGRFLEKMIPAGAHYGTDHGTCTTGTVDVSLTK